MYKERCLLPYWIHLCSYLSRAQWGWMPGHAQDPLSTPQHALPATAADGELPWQWHHRCSVCCSGCSGAAWDRLHLWAPDDQGTKKCIIIWNLSNRYIYTLKECADLSSVEFEEGEVCPAWDPVKAEDPINHSPPHSDQPVSHSALHLWQPWTCTQQLSADHIHHVILLILFILQGHVFILQEHNTT